MKLCRRCGCRLARDHTDDELCSPCHRSARDYDPRKDPFFYDKLLACLADAQGAAVEPLKALGLEHGYRRYVHSGIRALRKRGFIIRAAGSGRSAGYKYVGYIEISHLMPPCDAEDLGSP